VVDDAAAAARFNIERLGFTTTSDAGWFVSLSNGDASYELAFLKLGHEFLPQAYRGRPVTGVVLGFVVQDAAVEERRLRAEGVPIISGLSSVDCHQWTVISGLDDEPFGQRHFLCTDRNGIVLDLIELIPPALAWLAEHGA
jgi:hypothetical protein